MVYQNGKSCLCVCLRLDGTYFHQNSMTFKKIKAYFFAAYAIFLHAVPVGNRHCAVNQVSMHLLNRFFLSENGF